MASPLRDRSKALSMYFVDIRNRKKLSREEEADLSRDALQGCSASAEALVRSNLYFVVKTARAYRNLGLPFEDLLNEGNLGLIEAARRYDSSKGTKFITYAIWWIRKAILKALTDHSSLVRVPSYQMKRVREIRDAEVQLRRKLDRDPTRSEISDHLSSSTGKIDQALQFNLREVGLEDRVSGESERTIAETLANDASADPEDSLIRREQSRLVGVAMAELTDQQRDVVAMRYGMAGSAQLTLSEIGRIIGLSRERVRQIENQAKTRLRQFFATMVKSPQKPPYPECRLETEVHLRRGGRPVVNRPLN